MANLGWRMNTRWRFRSKGLVVHRGMLYPRTFTAVLTRDDGLEVSLDIEVEEEAGPTPRKVTIAAESGIRGRDTRLPIAAMTKYAAASLANEPSGGGNWNPVAATKPVSIGPLTAPSLKRVAQLYKRAMDEGCNVGDYLSDELVLSKSRAYGLVREARKAGLLPATIRGRATR